MRGRKAPAPVQTDDVNLVPVAHHGAQKATHILCSSPRKIWYLEPPAWWLFYLFASGAVPRGKKNVLGVLPNAFSHHTMHWAIRAWHFFAQRWPTSTKLHKEGVGWSVLWAVAKSTDPVSTPFPTDVCMLEGPGQPWRDLVVSLLVSFRDTGKISADSVYFALVRTLRAPQPTSQMVSRAPRSQQQPEHHPQVKQEQEEETEPTSTGARKRQRTHCNSGGDGLTAQR